MHPRVILASTSKYRAELLARLGIAFEQVAPEVDEIPLSDETPAETSQRLARLKAEAVAKKCQDAIVIGSDQVLALGLSALGKPGNHERAVEQLHALSGQLVTFYTAVCLIDTRTMASAESVAKVVVQFRHLELETIEKYLRIEKPYDCAGSAKSEALGIALLERIDSSDPTALVGLPLISVVTLLEQLGVPVFDLIQEQ